MTEYFLKSPARPRPRGTSIVELIIVTVLFIVMVPAALGVFVGARKINGQSYLQHQAAVTLGETSDILNFLSNMDFDLITLGQFYLIRNPGTGSWLTKSDLPVKDPFERRITVSSALRHTVTNNLYLPGESGASVTDPDTKKIDISILWAPDYRPVDILTQTFYLTNWEKKVTY